ncbi:LysR family transcriptional regulator [Pseudomonas sp. NPDC088368]|jgi:DNA-binding transcriptional LysR family regulator|uniref:LysR family transcriptional regulator n=1 Tax=Pseudomonas sp. NPDC088368 TaxID=3364453 RepID=UPI003801DFD3
MSDRFQELVVFTRAADLGSFSAAARELGLSQPSVSRIISELETRLDTRLLTRSTRRIVPTDAGVVYLQKARQLLHDLDDAEASAKGQDSLHGRLRVALPAILAVRHVIPELPAFVARHPNLDIELLTSDDMHDLIAEAADLAVRFGPLEDSNFGAKKLAVENRLLVASPVYLSRFGIPEHPQDLLNHTCVAGPGGSASKRWLFTANGQAFAVPVRSRIRVTSSEATLASGVAGLGIIIASEWMCRASLADGSLVRLLPGYSLDAVDVHAVFPKGRVPSSKVRMFTEFLIEVLAKA